MRKLVIISAIIIFAFTVSAQERFYNLYEGWSANMIIELDSTYQVLGRTIATSGGHELLGFEIDKANGTELGGFSFQFESYLSTSSAALTRNSTFLNHNIYSVGLVVISYENYLPYLVKLDSPINDTIFTRVYPELFSNLQMYFTHILLDNDKLYCIGSTSDNNYHIGLSFHKMDTLGVIEFGQHYNSTSNNPIADISKPIQIIKTYDEGFAITFEESFDNGSFLNQDAYCMKVDSIGNEEWRCSIGHHDTLNYRPFVLPIDNGNFIYTYSDPKVVNPIDPEFLPVVNDSSTIWIGEISSTGNKLWKRNLGHDLSIKGSFYVNDIYRDLQGNLFLAGERVYGEATGFLLKINTQHQAEWMQLFHCFPENDDSDLTYTKIYGLTPTSDGGFIMAGEYFSVDSEMFPGGIQSSLVIKVDECGCLEEGCNPECFTTTPQTQHIRMLELEIYPNPADDHLRINFDGESGWLKLFDCRGQVCLEQKYVSGTVLDISTFTSGVYTVRVNANGKFFQGQFIKE